MRIVLDMQGAQTQSRFRGIGRYTLAFARAVVEERGEHDVHLVLNGLLSDSIQSVRSVFDGLLPADRIHVWTAPGPVQLIHSGNATRFAAAEMMREAFIEALNPDLIHVTSLFEGYVGDAVTSVGVYDKHTPVSVTLYDLIPLTNRDKYLSHNPSYEQYYLQKLEHLKSAAINLAISDFSRVEATALLDLDDHFVANKSSAADERFRPMQYEEGRVEQILKRLGIKRPFILYTGGSDERKNLISLIKAYQKLPEPVYGRTQLVFAGRMSLDFLAEMRSVRQAQDRIVLTDFVSEEDLVALYNLCDCFVFPSWHEGFGLPVLEAMSCGAVVVAANAASVPEVLGATEALFDPFDVDDMSAKLRLALSDEGFRERMKRHALCQSKRFSWSATARAAISAWESVVADRDQAGVVSRSPGNRNVDRHDQNHDSRAPDSVSDETYRLINALRDRDAIPSSAEEMLWLAKALHENGEAAPANNADAEIGG